MKAEFIWRSLMVLSLSWLTLGDNVEVSADGATANANAMTDCASECAGLVQKSSVALEHRLKTIEKAKAEAEKVKEDLLIKTKSLEDSVAATQKQLKLATDRAENAERQQSNESNEQINTLRSQLAEATELQKAAEGRATECNALLDSVIEREKKYKEEANAHFESFRAEVEDLTHHKHKASELATLLEDLKTDLDMHKTELESTRDSLTKDLEEHRMKLRETADSHERSKKDLFAANARMIELHDQVTTTYVNTTLIKADAKAGVKKAIAFSVACCVAAKEAALPYWFAFVEFITPWWNDAVLFFNRAILPQIEKASDMISENYKQHLKPPLDQHVFPVLEPVLEPVQEYLGKLRLATARGLEQGSLSLLHYLELTETASSPIQDKAIAMLKFTNGNSVHVLDNACLIVLILVTLRFVWPKRKKKIEEEPAVEIGKPSPRRKGLRVRNNRVAAPTQ